MSEQKSGPLSEDRRQKDPNVAQEVFESLYPLRTISDVLLEILAEGIERAHAKNPESWSVAVRKDSTITFSVGQVYALRFSRGVVDLLLSNSLPNELQGERPTEFKALEGYGSSKYDATKLVKLWDRIRGDFLGSIDLAAKSKSRDYESYSPGLLSYIDKQLDRHLPRPHRTETKVISTLPDYLAELVRLRYPGWGGVHHADFAADEIHDKKKASDEAVASLAEEQMLDLLDAGDGDLILDHVEDLVRSTGLLYVRGADTDDLGALRVARREGSGVELGEAVYNLLYSSAVPSTRLGLFADQLDKLGLPNKWTLPTLLLFLVEPESNLFVKPRVIRWFMDLADPSFQYQPRPTGETYQRILNQAHALLNDLRPYGAQDMIDLQSVLSVAASEANEDGAPEFEARPLQDSSGVESSGPAPETTRTRQAWKLSPGRSAEYWHQWHSQGFASVGWHELGDLTDLTREQFEERRDAAIAEHRLTPDSMEQAWKFAHEIEEGDTLVANEGTSRVLGFGEIVGPYRYVPDAPQVHQRAVQWDDTEPRKVEEGGWRRTLIALTPEKVAQLRAARPDRKLNDEYTLAAAAADLHHQPVALERWVRAIRRKRQAILYGPPGTGKTYTARKLAQHLVGGGDGFVELIQFHPSYAYEDFMQGIRPVTSADGALSYEVRDGRFLSFCKRARGCTGASVLIIDEINRANLSRVFGELMYLLEYREHGIPLAGGREHFRIPENVYILGTMNTADRSIALIDAALRRRFAFLALRPDFDVLRSFHAGGPGADHVEPLIALLERVNFRLDDPHQAVGVTFFLNEDLPDHLEEIWRLEVEPYLEDRFYDDPAAVDEFRWDQIRRDFPS